MDAQDINGRDVVAVEFEVVWARTVPGNRLNRATAKYWFREGRNHGIAIHAALEREYKAQLHERIEALEKLETAALSRRVRRLTEALTELEACARTLRQAARSGNELKRDLVRVDAAIHNARKELNK